MLHEDGEVDIDLAGLIKYLKSRGWTVHETIGEKAEIWEKEGCDVSIWLPLYRAFHDFTKLTNEAISKLAKIEARSREALLADLTRTASDVIRVRFGHGLFDSSTVPFADGFRAIDSARNVIMFGSRSLEDPRAAYYSRPTGKVSKFLRTLQLGQTEISSYVITLISSVVGREAMESRDYLVQAAEAISTAKEMAIASVRERDLRYFNDAWKYGVSANLCEALAALSQSSPDNASDLTFIWEASIGDRRVGKDSSYVLDSSLTSTLSVAALLLRSLDAVEAVQLRGNVRSLTDRTEEFIQSEAVLFAEIEGKYRSVKFTVEGELRRRTVRAFDDRSPILVKGRLLRHETPYKLISITDLLVIDETLQVEDYESIMDPVGRVTSD